MNKSITLKHVGFRCSGAATINLWGMGQSIVNMDSWDITIDDTQSIINGINDGQFGCKSVESATVAIYDLYEQNFTKYNRSIIFRKDELTNVKRGIKDNKN